MKSINKNYNAMDMKIRIAVFLICSVVFFMFSELIILSFGHHGHGNEYGNTSKHCETCVQNENLRRQIGAVQGDLSFLVVLFFNTASLVILVPIFHKFKTLANLKVRMNN